MTATRQLVIVGGGHAHLIVLRALARAPEPNVQVTVLSPHPQATYTGMVPGVLAGQYRLAEAEIDLARLAAAAGARFLCERVIRIDARQRRVETEGDRIDFDWLSLDIGSQPAAQHLIRGDATVAIVKPIEVAVAAIDAQLRRLAGRVPRVVIVGGGAGGVEIAFAAAARLRSSGGGSVVVIDTSKHPVAGRHPNTGNAVLEVFRRHQITFLGGIDVTAVEPQAVLCGTSSRVAADAIVWATGAEGPRLLRDSDLPVDERGFLCVDDELRCTEHEHILGAGDCVAMSSHPKLAKAGVYAVRQGPVLAANLRAALRGKALRAYKPQAEFLSLLNTGDGKAILSYGRLAHYGRAPWLLKDWIDRRFVAKFDQGSQTPDPLTPEP